MYTVFFMNSKKHNNIRILKSFSQHSKVCESILRSLPQWFGIEQALIKYLEEIEKLPTLLAQVDNRYVGFLTFKRHNRYAAELYIIGIYPEYQRCGIGRTLVRHAESILRQQNIEYWQVKTLAASHPDPFYKQTRAFYLAMGFRPLEEFTQLWGKDNPCLLMIKHLLN